MAEQSQEQQNELLFMQLAMMFQGMAMQNLGKVMNPVTNQVERNLDHAKNFIDILGMLDVKTKGNLNQNEARLLEHILYELRMNYVDELKKAPGETKAHVAEGDEADVASDTPEEKN